MKGPSLSPEATLVAELNHEINSPLAAVRNALYLAGCCSPDPELHRYLRIADAEITSIAATLKAARIRVEQLAQDEPTLTRKPPLALRRNAAA